MTDRSAETHDWKIFTGSLAPHDGIKRLPAPPPWRNFKAEVVRERRFAGDDFSFERSDRGRTFRTTPEWLKWLTPLCIYAVLC
jgi:hypothetical protein